MNFSLLFLLLLLLLLNREGKRPYKHPPSPDYGAASDQEHEH
jgi:hypothetical protein